jgi:hypothetical protein
VQLLIEKLLHLSETVAMLPFSPQWRRIATALLHLLPLPLVMSLPACVPIQIEYEDEELFQAEQVAFIEIGRSTKEDISAAMLKLAMEMDEAQVREDLTPTEYRDGRWWLYTQKWSSDRWMFLPLYPDLPYVTGETEYRFLLINFDDNNIVAHYELSTLRRDGCNRSGICKIGSNFMLLARPDDVRIAKQFESPVERCGVYLYKKASLAIPIERDGNRVGKLVDDDHFLYWQLDPGTHRLKSLSLDDSNHGPIEFGCAAGELYFFELKPRKKGAVRSKIWVEILERDPVEGRQAIDNRQLILSMESQTD